MNSMILPVALLAHQVRVFLRKAKKYRKIKAKRNVDQAAATLRHLGLEEFLFRVRKSHDDGERVLSGATTFDREHNLLFILERLVGGCKSVVHIWQER